MKELALPELWHAVYRQDGKTAELIALFKRVEDASAFHDNPTVYFNCRRRVALRPAPIAILEGDVHRAIELLDAIVFGPDEHMPIDEARSFLESIHARTAQA